MSRKKRHGKNRNNNDRADIFIDIKNDAKVEKSGNSRVKIEQEARARARQDQDVDIED